MSTAAPEDIPEEPEEESALGPVMDPESNRLFVIQEINEIFRDRAPEAAYAFNTNLESVSVLTGRVEPFVCDDEVYYQHALLSVIRYQPDIAAVIVLYDNRYFERTNYLLDFNDEQARNLTSETGDHDSEIRFMLTRTSFQQSQSQSSLEYLRVNQIPELSDIAYRVGEIDGPQMRHPPAA